MRAHVLHKSVSGRPRGENESKWQPRSIHAHNAMRTSGLAFAAHNVPPYLIELGRLPDDHEVPVGVFGRG